MAIKARPGLAHQANRAEQALQQAERALGEFLNPADENCGVDPEVRVAAKQFLESWVMEPIRESIAFLRDEHPCVKCGEKFSILALSSGFCKKCLYQ